MIVWEFLMGFFTYSRAFDRWWSWGNIALILFESFFQFVLKEFHHFVDLMRLCFSLILELSPTCAQEIPPLCWSCVVLKSWRDPPLPLCECSTSLQFQQRGVGDHLKMGVNHVNLTLKLYIFEKRSASPSRRCLSEPWGARASSLVTAKFTFTAALRSLINNVRIFLNDRKFKS